MRSKREVLLEQGVCQIPRRSRSESFLEACRAYPYAGVISKTPIRPWQSILTLFEALADHTRILQ